MVTYLGSLVQLCCGQGGTKTADRPWRVWGALAVPGPHCACPAQGACFAGLRCSGSRLLRRGLSAAGRVACPPRSRPLRFRSSGTPQRRGVGPAFVPFQGPGSSGTRCVARALPRWGSASYHLPVPAARFPRCTAGVPSQGCLPCVSSGELIFGCNPPDGCQPSRIPGSLG